MANTAQARKRARQAEDHRERNASQRSMVRTYIRHVLNAVAEGNKTKAEQAFKAALPIIDRMARKRQLSKNTAARQKSRLNKQIRAMA